MTYINLIILTPINHCNYRYLQINAPNTRVGIGHAGIITVTQNSSGKEEVAWLEVGQIN